MLRPTIEKARDLHGDDPRLSVMERVIGTGDHYALGLRVVHSGGPNCNLPLRISSATCSRDSSEKSASPVMSSSASSSEHFADSATIACAWRTRAEKSLANSSLLIRRRYLGRARS